MPTPRIFVSHSHHDNLVCRQIVDDMRQSFPDAPIFYDESELHAGDEWMERIQREVINAPIFIVILSPHSVVARWVKTETNLALNLAMEDPSRKIIPVSIDARVDKTAIMQFVPLLILRQIIDMTDAAPNHTPQHWPDLTRVIRGEASDVATQPQVAPAEAQRLQSARDLARQIHDAVAQQQWLLAITLGKSAILAPGNEQDDALLAAYAQALLAENDTATALTMIDRALALNGIRPDYWQIKAQIYEQSAPNDAQAQEAALAAYQQAFIHAANTTFRLTILVEQFRLELATQRWQEAQRTTRLALQLAPGDATWQTKAQQVTQAQTIAEQQAREAAQRKAEEEKQRLDRETAERLARIMPASLAQKQFQARAYNGVEVIIPPIVAVPAGAFLMGSDKKQDTQAYDDEVPQRTVTLATYQIAMYPLTVAEYACFVNATNRAVPQNAGAVTWQKQLAERQDHPVVCITWQDALAYAQWLAQVTGEPYRLPSEAEWERAARGTDGRIYPWGNQWDKTRANTNDGGPGTTTPIGSYPQGVSPVGVMDMSGNVLEWTSTLYKPYPYNATDGREDAKTAGSRVLRGGSWDDNPRYARAAYRGNGDPTIIDDDVGARLVRVGAG
jgi:formylglycine-generating enzyme required for sulfatase activity